LCIKSLRSAKYIRYVLTSLPALIRPLSFMLRLVAALGALAAASGFVLQPGSVRTLRNGVPSGLHDARLRQKVCVGMLMEAAPAQHMVEVHAMSAAEAVQHRQSAHSTAGTQSPVRVVQGRKPRTFRARNSDAATISQALSRQLRRCIWSTRPYRQE